MLISWRKPPVRVLKVKVGSLSKQVEAGLGKNDHRCGIRRVDRQWEVAISLKEADEKYVGKFCDLVNGGGYLPQQVINRDETGLL